MSSVNPISGINYPTELGARKRKCPAHLAEYDLGSKKRKIVSLEDNSQKTLGIFASANVKYRADVDLDPKYADRLSAVWAETPLSPIDTRRGQSFIRSIKHMKDDASDVYAQALEIQDVVFYDKDGAAILEKGLFARTDIKKNQVIGVYAGELLPIEDLQGDKRYEYLFEFPGTKLEGWAIDGRNVGNLTRFMNHCDSKRENVSSYFFFYGDRPRIIFEASRDIKAGEQLMYDYGDGYWERTGIVPN